MMKNKIVTVFGGNGFLGRSVVQRLAQQGARVRVAVRDTDKANRLRVSGDVGQVVPLQVCLRDQQAVESVCHGAHSVINLTGRLYEKRQATFNAVHVEGAHNIAKACVKHKVQHFVHISALGADPKSRSKYAKTKALGEKKVQKAFPNVTILRPSLMFGAGDRFFGRFADLATLLPFFTLFKGGRTKFQPVYVGDVAQAVLYALQDKKTQGKIYELGGPKIYTFKDLMTLIIHYTGRQKMLIPLPSFMATLMAKVLQFMPEPLITPDQLKLLEHDNVVTQKAKGLKDLGINAAHLEAIVPTYLSCYKPHF